MPDKSTDEAPKKKGKIGKILIFVIGGLLLVGVGLGVGYVLFGLSAPTPSEEIDIIIERKLQESGQLPAPEDATAEDAAPARQTKPVEAEPTFITSYYEFPTEFTTNLNGSRKFLRLAWACPPNMMRPWSQMSKHISSRCAQRSWAPSRNSLKRTLRAKTGVIGWPSQFARPSTLGLRCWRILAVLKMSISHPLFCNRVW